MEKKDDESAEGIGEVSGRKWRARLSFLSGFGNPLRVRELPIRESGKAANSASDPVFEDENKVDTGSRTSLPLCEVIIRRPLEISSQESRRGVLLDFCGGDKDGLMILRVYVYTVPRRERVRLTVGGI